MLRFQKLTVNNSEEILWFGWSEKWECYCYETESGFYHMSRQFGNVEESI